MAAGRIISAEGEGWQVTRVIPVCAISGQAAGTAAALSIRDNTSVSTVDIFKLQNQLTNDKLILNF